MKTKISILTLVVLLFISICGNAVLYQKSQAKNDYGDIVGTYMYGSPEQEDMFQLTVGHDGVYYIYRDDFITSRGTYEYSHENIYSIGNDSFMITFKDKLYVNSLGNMFILNKVNETPAYINGNQKYAVDLLLDLYTSDYTRYLTYTNTNDLTPYIEHYSQYATSQCLDLMKRYHNLFLVADSYHFYENTKLVAHNVKLTQKTDATPNVYIFEVSYSIGDDNSRPLRTASGEISLSGKSDDETKVQSISLYNQLDLVSDKYIADKEKIANQEKEVKEKMDDIVNEISSLPIK